MSDLSLDLHVEAPADLVWDVVRRRFHRIGEWATAIPASAGLSAGPSPLLPPTSPTRPSLAVPPVLAGAPARPASGCYRR